MINLTEDAINQIKYLISLRHSTTIGMRIIVSTKGCSGISYDMDYVSSIEEDDHEIKNNNISIFIKKAHMLWIVGTTVDYEDDFFKPGFRFKNNRMKGKCNCGESFIF